jgi:hypothetical protein
MPRNLALALLIAVGGGADSRASILINDYVTLTRGSNQGTGGGAFDVNDLNDGPSGSVEFQTFCVEITEHISLGSTYFVYNISNHNDINGGLGVRTLGTAAAWLYTKYREGIITLTDPNAQIARDLQNAFQLGIWRGMLNGSNIGYVDADILAAVEGQTGWKVLDSSMMPIINPALNTILSGWLGTFAADAAWQAQGAGYTGGVQIMNLKTSPTGSYSQDQLIWEPVPDQAQLETPEPATLAVWSGLAAAGLIAGWGRLHC